MSKTVIILGNGFDLSLGLPTSYSALVNGMYFKEEVRNGNKLAAYLKEKSANTVNWHGFEEELLNYANERKPAADELYKEFLSLKKAIKSYYAFVDNNYPCKLGIGSDMIISNYCSRLQMPQEELLVINFNYTSSVWRVLDKFSRKTLTWVRKLECLCELILAFFGEDYNSKLSHISEVHPHGDVEHDIVFGVSDFEDLDEDYIFLKKSVSKNYLPGFTVNDLLLADGIIFFGHSLAVPDQHYFKEFFLLQSQKECNRKRIRIYFYGEKERLKLMKSLDEMTGKQLSLFQMYNDVKFIDSSALNYEATYTF